MEAQIGTITHYYNRINVAVVQLSGRLAVGDRIIIMGHTTDIEQFVTSMEVEHEKIMAAEAGAEIAIWVEGPVRRGDILIKPV